MWMRRWRWCPYLVLSDVDRSGVIRFGFVNPDYTHRVDPVDILDVLETLVSA